MLKLSSPVKLSFYARSALVLHGVFLTLLFLYLAKGIVVPLLFSLLISILLQPLALLLENKGLHRALSCGLAVLAFMIVLSGLVFFFAKELGGFSKELPQVREKMTGLIQNASDWISHKYNIDDTKQKDYINKSSHDLVSFGLNAIGTTFLGMAELIIISIFCLLFSFFILFYRRLLAEFLFSFFTSEQNETVRAIVKKIQAVINRYVLGLFIEMGLIILLSFSALSLFGIKYALLFALLAAVLNIIPYFGIYTAAAVSTLIIFAQGTPNQALEAALVFITIHIIDSNILLPAIVGGQVKMNPFISLLAIFAGKLFWGIPGMFLFIPLMAMFRIVSESVKELRPWSILLGEQKKKISRRQIQKKTIIS